MDEKGKERGREGSKWIGKERKKTDKEEWEREGEKRKMREGRGCNFQC